MSESLKSPPIRSRRDVVLGNSMLLGGVFFFNTVAGVLTSILLARLLTVEALGEYGFLIRVYSWLCAFAVFFLPQVLVRFVAELRGRGSASSARQLFRWAFLVQIAVILLVLAGVFLQQFLTGSRPDGPFLLVLVAFVVNSFAVVFENYLRGCQEFRPVARAVFLGAALRIAGLLSLFLLGADVFLALSVYTIGQMAHLCVLIAGIGTKATWRGKHRGDSSGLFREFRMRIARFGATMGLAGFLSLVTWNYVEVFVIGWTWSGVAAAEQLAFYTLAISLCMLPNRFTKALSGALSPAFAELHGRGDRQRILGAYRTATILSSAGGCWLAVYLLLFAPHFFHLLFPPSLYPAIPIFQILMIPSLFLALNYAGGVLLPTLDGHRFHLLLSGLAAPVTLLVAFLLIPRWGGIGAATSNAFMQGGCVVVSLLFLATRRGLPFPMTRILMILLAAFASVILSRILLGAPGERILLLLGQITLSIPIAFGLYGFLLRVMRIFSGDERDLLLRCERMLPGRLTAPWRGLVGWVAP